MKKKRAIVSILIIGLLLTTTPTIMGEITDAADRPDRLEESTDVVSLIDTDALFKLIDPEELDKRMESAIYAEDDVVMIVDVAPDQQESIGVEQMTIKKNGEIELKYTNPQPSGGTFVTGGWTRYTVPFPPVCAHLYAVGFFRFVNGQCVGISGGAFYIITFIGMTWNVKILQFETTGPTGDGWAQVRGDGILVRYDAAAHVWVALTCKTSLPHLSRSGGGYIGE